MKVSRIKINMCPGIMATRTEPRILWIDPRTLRLQRNRIYVPWCNARRGLLLLCFSKKNSLCQVWKARKWAFCDSFVSCPYSVRILYHRQLKNSLI